MICKEGSNIDIDVKEASGMGALPGGLPQNGGYTTLQHRRKSQLITFSASSCDIKNSLSHDLNRTNVRLSFAEEDVMILPPATATTTTTEDDVFRRRSLLEVELGIEAGEDGVELQLEEEELEEEDLYLHDEFETHIDAKSNNANDDSGGGSYEDSHALHSSLGGSNRNSLEKDEDEDEDEDDDIEVDVISTDVSCYDQLLGSSCNTTRNGDDNDNDDIATLIGDGDRDTYGKLSANVASNAASNAQSNTQSNALNAAEAGGNGGGGGGNCGIIYANPFMGL
ncbi:hypothetical protein KR044_007519 [Drosophila immigrans]|nr:hypothetical protein KR044_007519 [Drosophila immigrans]